MKLVDTESNRWTRIRVVDGWPDYKGAADRLISREMPGCFADSIAHYNLDNRPERTEFTVEAVRGVGGMTEHSGERFTFRIVGRT